MKFYLRNNFLRLSMKPATDTQFLDKIISFTNPKTNETSMEKVIDILLNSLPSGERRFDILHTLAKYVAQVSFFSERGLSQAVVADILLKMQLVQFKKKSEVFRYG